MKTKIVLFTLCVLMISNAGCNNEPLFTELVESKLSVVVKGSFESTGADGVGWGGGVPSVASAWVTTPGNGTISMAAPTRLHLDFSELRLNNKKFALYRRLYTAKLDVADPFFGDDGISYKSDDVAPNRKYTTLNMYIRKMIFNNAYDYDGAGTGLITAYHTVVFDNDDVQGYDFNQRQTRPNDDTDSDNLVFPFNIAIPGGFTCDGEGEWVLEVRIVINGNIAQYSRHNTSDTSTPYISYYAIDDVIEPTTTNSDNGYIGGNLAGVARAYKKGYTGTITNSTGSMLIGVPAGAVLTDYNSTTIIPPLVVPAGGTLENVPFDVAFDYYTVSTTSISTLLTTISTVSSSSPTKTVTLSTTTPSATVP